MQEMPQTKVEVPKGFEVATLGSGCFWCTEAVFQKLKGVVEVKSGYSGGHIPEPTYRQVGTGTSGHAEVVQIIFDPETISFANILEVFWSSHNPTTLNRQGADIGPQYRSAVFYHYDKQREDAESLKKKLDASGIYDKTIVTEITSFQNFYEAEDYHQNYYNLNGRQPYCQMVIKPKLEKFQEIFAERLK